MGHGEGACEAECEGKKNHAEPVESLEEQVMIFDWKLELFGTLHSVGQNLKDCPDKQLAEVETNEHITFRTAQSHCLLRGHAALPRTYFPYGFRLRFA